MGILDSLSKGLEQGRADVKKERRVAELNKGGERELAEPNKVAMVFGRAIERVAPAKDKIVHGAKAADKAIDRIQGKKPVTQARGRAPAPRRQGNPPAIYVSGGKRPQERAVSSASSGNMSQFAAGPDHAGVYGSTSGAEFRTGDVGPGRFEPDSGFRSDSRFSDPGSDNSSRFTEPKRRWI